MLIFQKGMGVVRWIS